MTPEEKVIMEKQTMSIGLITTALDLSGQIVTNLTKRVQVLEKTVSELQKVSLK